MKKNIFTLLLALLPLIMAAQEKAELQLDIPFNRSDLLKRNIVLSNDFVKADKSLDSLITLCIADIKADSIASYIQSLENFGTRFMLAANHRQVACWIRDKFISLGYPNAVLDSFQNTTTWPTTGGISYTTWQYNVIASLPGSQTPQVQTMLGGHHDAIIYSGGDPFFQAPGADDNASCVAATLEIARVLKARNIQPKSTICFGTWAAEERGLLGSIDYVLKSINSQRNIKAYLNLDMIGSEPDTTNWEFNINEYEGAEYLGLTAKLIALGYSDLNPTLNLSNSAGSDSYVFWLGGYPALYFSEKHFSPNYHQVTDLLTGCNIPYCAEITKVALGTLLTIDESPAAVDYELFNPGTGNSLVANWKPNAETDLDGYYVRVGYSSGNYNQVYTTTANFLDLPGLSPDTTYYVAVSAFNLAGTEGPLTEQSDKPVLTSFDQGILIVDDSEGGILEPADSTVDSFYSSLLENFQVTSYDAFMLQDISLADLGKYSSVLWHVNKRTSVTALNRNINEVVKYLRLGGNILFTLYQPQRAITKYTNYPASWTEGSFIYDFLKIDTIVHLDSSAFNHGSPATPGIPLIEVDTSKTQPVNDHHLSYIEALSPNNDGNIIYMYGTAYNSSTAQGSMAGLPVGVESLNENFKTVTLSFPLYYMNFGQAKTLVRGIMVDKFGETPTSLENISKSGNGISLSPNPADNEVKISLMLNEPSSVKIRVLNLLGTEIMTIDAGKQPVGLYSKTINLTKSAPGLYVIRTDTGNFTQTARLVVTR